MCEQGPGQVTEGPLPSTLSRAARPLLLCRARGRQRALEQNLGEKLRRLNLVLSLITAFLGRVPQPDLALLFWQGQFRQQFPREAFRV